MALDLRTASLLSSLAYNDDGIAGLSALGYSPIDEFGDPTTSGFFGRVYQNGNSIVIAFRGTDTIGELAGVSVPLNSLGFVGSHLQLQLEQAYNLFNSVNQTSNIEFTGHSLGGGLASAMGILTQRPATTIAAVASSPMLQWIVADLVFYGSNSVYASSALANVYAQQLQAVRDGTATESALIDTMIADYNTAVGPTENFGIRGEAAAESTFFSRMGTDEVINDDEGTYWWGPSHQVETGPWVFFQGQASGLHLPGLHSWLGGLSAGERLSIESVHAFIPQMIHTGIMSDAGFAATSVNSLTHVFLTSLVNNDVRSGASFSYLDQITGDALELAQADPQGFARSETISVLLSRLAVQNAARRANLSGLDLAGNANNIAPSLTNGILSRVIRGQHTYSPVIRPSER